MSNTLPTRPGLFEITIRNQETSSPDNWAILQQYEGAELLIFILFYFCANVLIKREAKYIQYQCLFYVS